MSAARLKARLKAREVSRDRVQWAARLGHAVAAEVTGLQARQDDPLVGCLKGKLLTGEEIRRFACDCVERLLPSWEHERPGQARPRQILGEIRDMAATPDEGRLRELCNEAYALRQGQVSDGADLVLTGLYCAAMPNAVDAARQAIDDLADGVALLAMDAAGHTEDEEVGHLAAEKEYVWQCARLCDYLLLTATKKKATKKTATKKTATKKKATKKKATKKKKKR